MRSGDRADSVARPLLAMDIFCISSDVEVTTPNAAPVGWPGSVGGASIAMASVEKTQSKLRGFAMAEGADITLPLSWIRRPIE